MPKNHSVRTSRIGRCRSNRPVDIPLDLEDSQLNQFLANFSSGDLVDMLSMIESLLSSHKENLNELDELDVLQLIGERLWYKSNEPDLKIEIKRLGLRISPDFVRHGQKLLLVKDRY